MADKPILFSGPMVRALIAGNKKQTRRVIQEKMQDAYHEYDDWCSNVSAGVPTSRQWEREFFLERLRIQAGDRLYVRETFSGPYGCRRLPPRDWPVGAPIWYRADGQPQNGDFTKPKPGMHMPRWASRLTLTVIDVRVERLQDISEEDAIAEGLLVDVDGDADSDGRPYSIVSYRGSPDLPWARDPVEAYLSLWDAINGEGAAEANPWVAAYGFTVERGNIDDVARSAS